MNGRNFISTGKNQTSNDNDLPISFYLIAFAYSAIIISAIYQFLSNHFKKSSQRRHHHERILNSAEKNRKRQLDIAQSNQEKNKRITTNKVEQPTQSTSTKQITDFIETIAVKKRPEQAKKPKKQNNKKATALWNLQSRNDKRNISRVEEGKNPIRFSHQTVPVPVLDISANQDATIKKRRTI